MGSVENLRLLSTERRLVMEELLALFGKASLEQAKEATARADAINAKYDEELSRIEKAVNRG